MNVDDKISELHERGFCVLRSHFNCGLIADCREAFLPVLSQYIAANDDKPNRGPYRHFLAMPFRPPCFAAEFFFDASVLSIVQGAMEPRIVADQWGCDIPVLGSNYQVAHADYQRPLFPEFPEMPLPPYMLVVSFGLVEITNANGPIEIAPGTHQLPRIKALSEIESGQISMQPITLNIGDVLIRHPWALHRGSPNKTHMPRPLATVRYVRRWYTDSSRDVNSIPLPLWQSFTLDQQSILRFPVAAG